MTGVRMVTNRSFLSTSCQLSNLHVGPPSHYILPVMVRMKPGIYLIRTNVPSLGGNTLAPAGDERLEALVLTGWGEAFHWVLFLFDLSACTVNVYDSMDKKESTFDKVFELIDRAWYRFCHLVRGKWRERLRRKFKFPCAKQKQGTNLCGYYVCEYCHCLADQIITTRELDFIRMRDNLTTHKEFIAAVQEQLMGFINEEILDPKGEFYYDGNTIHRSLASELAATTTTSKS
uniref:Transposon protein, putative, CACTA, En/Spm sub-class n=1 Tax=Oryza sativa subsp. japonica TaxID=39947 RepID=Q2QR94_ORYSJ|nr:transposon protein, putative, CACTA, En/Spm sub-class [Oryza sativa Japonica Group]